MQISHLSLLWIVLLLFGYARATMGQSVIIDEKFDDGEFTNDPTWTDPADTHYVVNSQNQLQLKAPSVKSESSITTPSDAAYGEWEAFIKMSFKTSSTSLARFYLIADTTNIRGRINGYYIEVGSSDDDIKLYRQDGNTRTVLIDGRDKLVDMSPVTARIKATRTVDGRWELFADSSGGSNFESLGIKIDSTYSISNYIGLFSKYISSRSEKFFFDDIKVTKVIPPLAIQNVNPVDNQTIEVSFNLDLDPNSVSTSDFSIDDGIGPPNSVAVQDNVVSLSYSNALPGGHYTLTVSGIRDQSGNPITPNTTAPFTLFDTFEAGDVIINEFMYNQPADQSEYIEIKNRSEKLLNLQDWQIGDDSNLKKISNAELPFGPDELLVFTGDSTKLFNIYGARSFVETPYLPALNNSGDAIRLLTDDGIMADSLSYEPDWGGQKIALERRSGSVLGTYRENWGDSPEPTGGTPGRPNQVAEDKQPPEISSLTLSNAQIIRMGFTERIDPASATNIFHYSISGSTINSATSTAPDSVLLSLAIPLQNAQSYTLEISDISDIFGNAAASDTTFTYYEVSPVDSGDIAINEFMFDPPPDSAEYIELYNHSDKSLDLQNWTLSDNRHSPVAITNTPFILPPDSFVVLAPDRSLSASYPKILLIKVPNFPALNNSGDQIIIRDSTSLLLDSLSYRKSWGGAQTALERRTTSISGNYTSNWADAPNGFGTPGIANEIAPDTRAPVLRSLAILNDQQLLLGLSEQLSAASAQNISNYSLSGRSTITSAGFSAPDSILLTLDQKLENASRYTLEISGVEDIFGNAMTTTDTSFVHYEISTATPSDIFISEFSYDPPTGQTEYIELHNPTARSFDLQSWTFSDNRNVPATITGDPFILPPDSFVVIAPDNSLLSEHPDILFITMGSRFPALNNSGDAIAIHDSSNTLLDSLYYHSNWGGSSVSLERRTTTIAADLKENWGDSPHPSGGTPGRANQIEGDQEAPFLRRLAMPSDQKVILSFNERLDSTAFAISNYQVSGIAVESAVKGSPEQVELNLGDSLKNAQSYQLSLSNIQDIFGNSISSYDTTFTYFKESAVDSGDVFINEFMYDPPEGSPEYIELYNPSEKTLNLQRWTLNDNTGNQRSITNKRHLLPPDRFIVLAADSSLPDNNPDISTIVMGSRFPVLNNGGDAIVVRDSSGMMLDSLQYLGNWGEQAMALERRSSNLSATYRSNWDLPKEGGGSPGTTNTVPPDQQPPTLSSFDIISSQTLRLIFNEELQLKSLSGSFSLSDKAQIKAQHYQPPDTVMLTLASPLKDAVSYTLSISDVEDLFGNILTKKDTTFTFYQPATADSGQVFINEFNYDPKEGETEYVELFNPTDYSFDLQGWTLSDNRSKPNVITASSFILPPKDYVILAPDNTLKEAHPEISLVTLGSRFPALNNSGDAIVIHNRSGTLIDSLQYTSNWGDDNTALERRTTSVSGAHKENWGAAPGENTSPGKPNTIPADNTPPSLLAAAVTDKKTVKLQFSERIASRSATDFSNYTISPNRNIQLISAHADSVTLFLADPFVSERDYTVTASNLSDIFGNQSSSESRKIAYVHLEDAKPKDIVINEIMANPDAGTPEFVELFNRSDKNIRLSGWTFGDAVAEVALPGNILLKSGEYLILTGSSTMKPDAGNTVAISAFPNLNNAGDALYLLDGSRTMIDSLYYRASWAKGSKHASLERKDPMAASNDPSNWEAGKSDSKSSPGRQNSAYNQDTTPPKVIFAKAKTDGSIELYFNEFIALTNELQVSIDGTPMQVASFSPANGNRLLLEKTSALSNPTDQSVAINNLTDLRGNTTPATDIAIAFPPQKGDLVINEIMFHPLNKSDDNKPNQSEYAELYNTRDYALSLEGLSLHDAPDEDGSVRELLPVSTTAKWVKAGGTVLVHADEMADFNQSRTATFFELNIANMQEVLRIGRSSLSLAATGDALYIADSTGATIDSVHYSKEWHNPNLIDTRGIALERITPGGESNQPNNWSSSVHPKGGTPKAQNSIFQKDIEPPKEAGISFAPNPFSPDDDGYEDNLIISYKLDQPDYLLRVNIFDRYGRHIKELADGKPAGFEGRLIWDGRRDGGQRNRIGIYIIIFEAIDSDSGGDKAFKKTVVIARKLN